MAAPRPGARAVHPRQRRAVGKGNFSVILPVVHGHQWQVVPGPFGQKLVAVDKKCLSPTNEEIVAVAAPLFMLLAGAIMMIPLII
jgi:hypothetical protein